MLLFLSLLFFAISRPFQLYGSQTQARLTPTAETLFNIAANRKLFGGYVCQCLLGANVISSSTYLPVLLLVKDAHQTQQAILRHPEWNSLVQRGKVKPIVFNTQDFLDLILIHVIINTKENPQTNMAKVKILLYLGANPNAKDKKGTPALTLAVEEQKKNLVAWMLTIEGLLVHEKDAGNNTALQVATFLHYKKIEQLLSKHTSSD